jgi:hypothetical protein
MAMEGKAWKPIIHRDIYVTNVFVEFPLKGDGQTHDYEKKGKYKKCLAKEGVVLYDVDRDSVSPAYIVREQGLVYNYDAVSYRFSSVKVVCMKFQ